MNHEDSRGPWYLLTGLVIGLSLGILYTRLFQPVRYVDTSPSTLRDEFKDQYRSLIAAAYLSTGDIIRANARLDLLQDPDKFRAITEQAQRTLAQDGDLAEARALGLLAIAVGQEPPGPAQAITNQPDNPTPTSAFSTPADLIISPSQAVEEVQSSPNISNPPAENSGSPEVAPSSAIVPDTFVLTSRTELCDQVKTEPLIALEIVDRAGAALPGELVIVTWAGGEERFYTGLKPEKGLGYADYALTPGFVYSLRIGENGVPLGNIEPVSCTNNDGQTYWGVTSLKFAQP